MLSIFLVVIFSSRCTINLCQNKSSFTFLKKNFNKVSDKLLGQLLVLPAAKGLSSTIKACDLIDLIRILKKVLKNILHNKRK